MPPQVTFLSSFVFYSLSHLFFKVGIMNWDWTTRRMLPNSTTVVGLRMWRRQAAPPASMFLMMNDHENNILKLFFTKMV
ncbi:unnamed protein product [Citrullus colocynthis]|uniref:Secreted protein n=1 Tax=Citrullus colocynthis TaxID=252529 RepID=A0ABP0XQJ8_9ROSI